MDLFDFFFPEQAEASHLRNISQQLSAGNRAQMRGARAAERTSGDVADLRKDVEFLTLVVMGIVKRLTEAKTMSLADLTDILKQVDGMDGAMDGGLDVSVLRGVVGVMKQQEEAPKGPSGGTAPPRFVRYRRI